MLYRNNPLDDLKFFCCQTDNGTLVVDEAKFFDRLPYRNGFTKIQLIPTNSSSTTSTYRELYSGTEKEVVVDV
jgi:hypothetical protein